MNSISPGPILTGIFGKGAGLDPAQADQDATRLEPVFRARLEAYQPIGRAGAPADVAAADFTAIAQALLPSASPP